MTSAGAVGGCLIQVPDAGVVACSAFIPGGVDVPLIGDSGAIPVVDVEFRIARGVERGDFDPGHERAGGVVVALDLMI